MASAGHLNRKSRKIKNISTSINSMLHRTFQIVLNNVDWLITTATAGLFDDLLCARNVALTDFTDL